MNGRGNTLAGSEGSWDGTFSQALFASDVSNSGAGVIKGLFGAGTNLRNRRAWNRPSMAMPAVVASVYEFPEQPVTLRGTDHFGSSFRSVLRV